MNALHIHRVAHIKAKADASEADSAYRSAWVSIEITDEDGVEFEITLFTNCRAGFDPAQKMAARIASAINSTGYAKDAANA